MYGLISNYESHLICHQIKKTVYDGFICQKSIINLILFRKPSKVSNFSDFLRAI